MQIEIAVTFEEGGNWYKTVIDSEYLPKILADGVLPDGKNIAAIVLVTYETEEGEETSLVYDFVLASHKITNPFRLT